MALQTDNLVMAALGVRGDVPPNAIQPQLADGIHLRWSFRTDLGFPWHGFFLFRRTHRPSRPVCLGQILPKMPVGTWPSTLLNTPFGQLTSDQNIVFTDDFPAAGSVEFDLRARKYLRFAIDPAQRAYRVEARIAFRAAAGEPTGKISVEALGGAGVIAQATAHGGPGEVVQVALEGESISGVGVSGGPAALVDLCFYFVSQNATNGWEPVPGFKGPMCLPVMHPQYPCGPRPTDQAASEGLALSRVLYGPASVWAGQPFSELHAQLLDLVQDGPAGGPMADQHSPVEGAADPPDPEVGPPAMLEQYPLQLVLFASLHAAVAQMLGLYWVDREVDPNHSYDYLVVADHAGVGQSSASTVLGVIAATGFAQLDGYIVFGKRLEPAPPFDPPGDVRCYALPGTTVAAADGSLVDATSNAGLRWALEEIAPGVLKPGAAFMYHVWRDGRGNGPTPGAPGAYELVAPDPVLVPRPELPPGVGPVRPLDWPPFPLHYIDGALAEGWYSYRVSGIDIFGRHSPASADARWLQWTPAPKPRPWYYQDPAGDSVIHPSAVRLLDKIGPPPPHAVEAFALDPADPALLRDALYTAWFDALSAAEKESLIGLRVRWRWTHAHLRQAPDTREFRIYLQPDFLNARPGRITGIASATPIESDVQTDIANTHGADAWVGAWLRVGPNAFRVIGSGGTPLSLRVKHIGASDEIAPPDDAACTLTVPQVYNTGSVSVTLGSTSVEGAGTRWTTHLVGMPFRIVGDIATYSVAAVNSPTELLLDRDYEGPDGAAKPYGIRFPLYVDFLLPLSWQERVYVVPFDEHVTVTSDADGHPLRKYDVIIPAAGDVVRPGLQLATSLAEPLRYAHVGVSAADDKPHTPDDPKWASGVWGGGDRFGNEGPVSAPSKVFVVRRTPPPPPDVPADAARVYASRADYHSHSFYTFRWVPSPGLQTHVFRALDEAIFRADWERRAADASDLDANQAERFPTEWTAAKRQQVAGELNELNSFAHDADKPAAMAYYRSLSNDGLRALAALPGNERAFTQITIRLLDPDDPSTANRRGPDNAADHPIDPGLRAYVDTLDGRSANRYFYRSAYVDAVHNRGALSLSSPPVWLPDVVPPRTPVVTRVLGGDRAIAIRWSPNRESDLAEYRVFRAPGEAAARDLRLMALVHTRPVTTAEIAAPPAEVTFTDTDVVGLVTYYYRLVAVDTAGNMSTPSPHAAGRAFDDSRPAPPTWEASVVDGTTGVVTLQWSSPVVDLTCLVQRSPQGAAAWTNASGWLARGVYTFADATRAIGATYDYRLRVMDARGRLNTSFSIETV